MNRQELLTKVRLPLHDKFSQEIAILYLAIITGILIRLLFYTRGF